MTLESLAADVEQLRERLEDMEDVIELRAAVDRNAGKPGTPWEKVKVELGLERQPETRHSIRDMVDNSLTAVAYGAKKSLVSEKRIFVERRASGDYAVRRAGSDRASAVEPTQRKAIEKARHIEPGVRPHVERVRDTSTGRRDKWRKA
jgi:predicted AAA+ superfamily ATPase